MVDGISCIPVNEPTGCDIPKNSFSRSRYEIGGSLASCEGETTRSTYAFRGPTLRNQIVSNLRTFGPQ
jgi:hypothetical protein